ncbi:MAG: HEAT repeat domain-containing protein [Planctomycetota bacterium]|jgi:HEAT repeat protein
MLMLSPRLAIVLLLAAGFAYAHGSGPILVPPPEKPPEADPETPDNPPPAVPNSGVPRDPGGRTPDDKEGKPEHAPAPPEPPKPGPPPPQHDPNPGGPMTPPEPPPPPTDDDKPTPGRTGKPSTRAPVRDRRASGWDQTWRIWWELNRENLVGFRHVLKGKGTVTPDAGGKARATIAARREDIRGALLRIAQGNEDRLLRASALLALGRMGDQESSKLFLALLRDSKQAADVHEAAALALGMLGPIEDPVMRKSVREHLQYFTDNRGLLGLRAHSFVLFAAGMRARDDRQLVLTLANRAVKGARSGDEAVSLAFAFGLAGDPMLAPELLNAVERSRLGNKRIGDVGRSHALAALGRMGDPASADTCLKVLRARSSREGARRGAVLALARMLRTGSIDGAVADRVTRQLMKVFGKDKDPLVRGFAAVAVGGAVQPRGIHEFQRAIDHGGHAGIKGFAALAMGLAARRLDEAQARRVRAFLAEEFAKTREVSQSSALSIALGLSGATESLESLLERVQDKRRGVIVRGAAAQAVGLIGKDTPEAGRVLKAALEDGSRQMLGDVALALGMLGRRGTGQDLVAMLSRTKSTLHQGRIMLALGHLGSAAAVDPLLKALEDKNGRTAAREFAAVALGLLASREGRDPLFDIDADVNYYSLTAATKELVRLY